MPATEDPPGGVGFHETPCFSDLGRCRRAGDCDLSDIGRAAGMSSYLLPEELSDEEHALITVRVEAGGDVRTYRYWLDPDEEVIDEMVTAEEIEAGAEATAMDGEPDPEIAAAVP